MHGMVWLATCVSIVIIEYKKELAFIKAVDDLKSISWSEEYLLVGTSLHSRQILSHCVS